MPIELNENAPTEPARVKRHKPKRGLGSAITRKRRLQAEALEKEVNDRREAARTAARNEMARIAQRKQEDAASNDARWASNLLRSVVGNQTAVLRSYGYTQGVQCDIDHNTPSVTAWTDFRRIYVAWPKATIPSRLSAPEEVLDTVAQMKGVMQHEMGHLRFTTPWTDVVATQKLPKEFVNDHVKAGLLQTCWNMLEDQRMECLVVESVPRIKKYFGTMVANVILGGKMVVVPIEQTWVMLAGRTYLPPAILQQSALMFDAFCAEGGIKNGARTWEGLVNDYKAATTHKQLLSATVAAYEFIQKVRATMPPTVDDHSRQQGGNDPKENGRRQGSILDMFDENQESKPKQGKGKRVKDNIQRPGQPGRGQQPSNEKDGDEGDSGEGDGEGKEGDKDGQGKGKGESDDHSDGTEPNDGVGQGDGGETLTPEQDFQDALSGMADHFRTQMREDADVREMARNANLSSDAEGLPEYDGSYAEMSADMQSRAMNTAVGITQALNSFVTTSAPIWQNRKEVGVIDPLAYRTKATGDRDFRRHLDDHGNTGLDVHVSMLCDVSGSMGGGPMQALSESLYATGIACKALDIGFTFSLWSSGTQYYRVWRDGEPKPWLFPSMGGTDPTKALDDLDSHNEEGAARHLVVIFTDGAWSYDFPSLQRWATPERTFVLVRYGAYDGEVQKDMGADSHIGISNVMDLPSELTKALIDVLGESGW